MIQAQAKAGDDERRELIFSALYITGVVPYGYILVLVYLLYGANQWYESIFRIYVP